MAKTAFRFYWDNGSGKSGNTELMALIIAPGISEAITAFSRAFPEHPLELVKTIEVMMDQVVVA